MISNQPELFLSLIVRVRIVVVVVLRRVRVTKIDQSTPWQRTRWLRLPPRVDAVEKLGERDGAVAGIGGGIFLVRAQIWRRDIAKRRGRRRWVCGEQWVEEGEEAISGAIHSVF
jgi:hypothetical protein